MANEKRLISSAPSRQPWWGSYKSMMGRCYRKTAVNFDMYGGRGIKVCDEWFNPDAFGEWAKESGFQKGFTLERKDVNGNYCPENCTWATPKQQANNRRNTIFLEWHGERKSIHQWADEMGVSASTLKNRYYLGWSAEEILTLDAEPVIHGHWVRHNFLGHDQFACSECQTLGSPQWKRCPVCEAKMDGERKDNGKID